MSKADTILTTQAQCENAEPWPSTDGKPPRPRLYRIGNGLLLQSTPTKPDENGTYNVSRSWLYRYTSPTTGKERRKGLGSLDTLTLDNARLDARLLQRQVEAGIDPLDAAETKKREGRAQAAAVPTAKASDMTFKACATAYMATHLTPDMNAIYRQQYEQSLRDFVYPTLGHKQVADIDEQDILDVLTPIWRTKTKTASDLRARIAKILGWAAARPRSYRSNHNPAAWDNNLEHSLPKPSAVSTVKGHPALPYREVGAFVAKLRQDPWIAARALEFCVLTATRASETRLARWSEIDLAKALWTIPAKRMKMSKPHVVPLSDRACAILRALSGEELQGTDEPIFQGRTGRRLATSSMLDTCRRVDKRVGVHGFRKSFRNWAGSRVADFPAELAEFALAHVKKGIEGIYHTETSIEGRRPLMQSWADFIDAPQPAVVVPMKRIAAG
jgi:integrase